MRGLNVRRPDLDTLYGDAFYHESYEALRCNDCGHVEVMKDVKGIQYRPEQPERLASQVVVCCGNGAECGRATVAVKVNLEHHIPEIPPINRHNTIDFCHRVGVRVNTPM